MPSFFARALLTVLAVLTWPAGADDRLAALGELLFFDPDLSRHRTQSCATCHAPDHAFVDPRSNADGRAVSLGDDGESLGQRNTPSIAYAQSVPRFELHAEGPRGGLFLDGRAPDLESQAGEPLLNPLEMAMPDRAAVVARLREKADYVARFSALFGAGVLDDTARAFEALTRAIAAFERSAAFATYDSRYDRYLAGDIELTIDEELGRRVFFSDLTNCMNCHLLEPGRVRAREPFSDHRYHNIGVPPRVRASGAVTAAPDPGLAANPAAGAGAAGRFRTPSLRNVAVTAPYMHNGVFDTLETAIHFYNRYLVINDDAERNPETGRSWGPPEVAENIDRERLTQGQPLGADRIASLISFLRALTDRRYEPLLPDHRQPHKDTDRE